MKVSWILPGTGLDATIPVWRVVPEADVRVFVEALLTLGFSPTVELV